MAIGDTRTTAASFVIRRAAPIAGAPRLRAQPEIAMGFMLAARDDLAELAAHPSAAVRSRLLDFA